MLNFLSWSDQTYFQDEVDQTFIPCDLIWFTRDVQHPDEDPTLGSMVMFVVLDCISTAQAEVYHIQQVQLVLDQNKAVVGCQNYQDQSKGGPFVLKTSDHGRLRDTCFLYVRGVYLTHTARLHACLQPVTEGLLARLPKGTPTRQNEDPSFDPPKIECYVGDVEVEVANIQEIKQNLSSRGVKRELTMPIYTAGGFRYWKRSNKLIGLDWTETGRWITMTRSGMVMVSCQRSGEAFTYGTSSIAPVGYEAS